MVYSYTPPSPGVLSLDLSSNSDLGLYVRTKCDTQTAELGCADNGGFGDDTLELEVQPGLDLAVFVDSKFPLDFADPASVQPGAAYTIDNTPVYVVPKGFYFGMGDNRDNSLDSRYFGFIPEENLVGRAEFLFFSTDGTTRWWEIWKWPFATRYDRLFRGVR